MVLGLHHLINRHANGSAFQVVTLFNPRACETVNESNLVESQLREVGADLIEQSVYIVF